LKHSIHTALASLKKHSSIPRSSFKTSIPASLQEEEKVQSRSHIRKSSFNQNQASLNQEHASINQKHALNLLEQHDIPGFFKQTKESPSASSPILLRKFCFP